ncbi:MULTISPECIES: alpha/beta fold hydrolase [Pseudonocardia]|uniref:2,6-dihydropseudooxynicotine hydrolase n=2 Tax=Pseudonocardia TaxID=1847 RepID=A0A1Y2N7D9_PSEAH|nr:MULTISPECIES: alpha/beta fold hydrolase [Pseudonocardia]OSY42808.1 2,6-dihydropseudooxynicotine hydrolase [Pseudonocardia autotrophica]TDN77385.1 hypothetical protein C8E95_6631 [Pseudonocardia autotrophica]BBG01408.1 hypothetical protein Pdca_26170 [Pseudonocardia autotrophica]GEC24464.1 hypothetical protein PSA01_14930 [Pseudonocardia saturnea]
MTATAHRGAPAADAHHPPEPPEPAEVVELARLHAGAQGISRAAFDTVVGSIGSIGDAAGSIGDGGGWAAAWARVGDRKAAAGLPLDACRHHAMARWPYPADPAGARSAIECVRTFDIWRRRAGGIDRLDLDLPGGRVGCWTTGLDPAVDPPPGPSRPLVLVLGGIVSIKEQWAPLLTGMRRLGLPVVVTELPSVGENTVRYGPAATDLIPQLLDRLGPHACRRGVHVIGLSFGGHLALAAAPDDPRIASILTVGAPVHRLFADRALWPLLPRTTTATLEHLTGTRGADTPALLSSMALSPDALGRVRIPVRYVASRRDEIVPRSEWELLARHLPDLEWVEFDDVHGAPAHLADTRLWLVTRLLRQCGDRRAAVPGALLALRGRAGRGGRTSTRTVRNRS